MNNSFDDETAENGITVNCNFNAHRICKQPTNCPSPQVMGTTMTPTTVTTVTPTMTMTPTLMVMMTMVAVTVPTMTMADEQKRLHWIEVQTFFIVKQVVSANVQLTQHAHGKAVGLSQNQYSQQQIPHHLIS